MLTKPPTIEVSPGTERDRLLDQAGETKLVLTKNRVRYLLQRETEDIWANYDPELSRRAIIEAAGGWTGNVDAEALKTYIRERRRTKNRPSIQWSPAT